MRRGHRPLLAGRSADKVRPIAERHGLDYVAFDLSDASALLKALEKVELVFHAAGPFIDTSDTMVRACLATNTSYIDVTGEVPVFANTYGYHEAAQKKRVLLLSGAGFDVVPTDCLANHVAAQVPGATRLEIAISGMASLSPGTMKSMFDGALNGGLVRRGGKLVPMPMGKATRKVRFVDRERRVLAIPWGDLESAYRSTGIRNITTYMTFPKSLIKASAATWPLTAVATPLLRGVLGRPRIKQAIQRSLESRAAGPDEQTRRSGRSQVWARASDGESRSAEGWLETVEGYAFTAVSGVRCVEKTLAERPAGALTPAQAFGKDFVLELDGTRRFDTLPAA